MKAKTLMAALLLAFVFFSLGYIVGEEVGISRSAQTRGANAAATQPVTVAAKHKVIAYYFHTTQRCMTCLAIEQFSKEALQEQFAEALESGLLEWHVVNVDEPQNRHFVDDYEIVTSSLVFVDFRDGKQADWECVEETWQYINDDEENFKRFVAEKARKYLESNP